MTSPPPPSGPQNIQTPPFKPRKPPVSDGVSDTTARTVWTTPCHFGIPTFLHVLKDLALHPERNSSLILRADPLPSPEQSQVVPSTSGQSRDDAELEGGELEKVDEVRVRLMPKQPNRDGKLDQRVVFYRTPERTEHEHPPHTVNSGDGQDEEEKDEGAVVVMIPLVKAVEDIPFFHPPVRKVIFTYRARSSAEDDMTDQLVRLDVADTELDHSPPAASDDYPVRGELSISYVPFDSDPTITITTTTTTMADAPLSAPSPFAGVRRTSLPRKRSPLAGPRPDSAPDTAQTPAASKEDPQVIQARLERTCLALLERVYKHGFGQMVGYRKRVNHDTVVKREPFQDLYLVLKERHRHLDSRAPKAGSSGNKVEDVKRHVYKAASLPHDPLSSASVLFNDLSEWGSQDVAIAAFLMLLWKDMYPPRPPRDLLEGEGRGEEWDTWGRPENGFIDLGCGNGLLVHILISEGYNGRGYELRARRTWPLYPARTQAALVEAPLDPPSWFPTSISEWTSGDWSSKSECVVQDNTFLIGNHADELTPWLPLLSLLPSTPVPHLSLPCCLHTWDGPFTSTNYVPPPHPHSPKGNFTEGLLEDGQSRYKSYLMWLGWVGLQCGWLWETEPLRIPSTRGWGIVARNRWADDADKLAQCRAFALEQVQGVRERGEFKIRVKEGKDH